MWNESRGNINVGMDHGNYSAGIAQVSRAVWKKYSSLPYSDASKAKFYMENLEVAAKYLKSMHQQFGSWNLAMAAYNEGPSTMQKILTGKRGLSPITQRYIANLQE